MIPGREAAPERQHSGDARVGGRGRARTTGGADGGSCGGRVAAVTCTGGVGFASLSAPCQAIVQLRRPTAPEKSLTAPRPGYPWGMAGLPLPGPKGGRYAGRGGPGSLTSDKVTASVSHVRHIHDEARAETGAQVIPLRPASGGCPCPRRTLNGGPPASSARVASVTGANQVCEDRRNRHEEGIRAAGRDGC